MDNELKRLPNLHLEDTNIMESITKKCAWWLTAFSIHPKTCTPIHHWHSQSYFAASWNATSSFLVSTRTWAVTKSNHHHLQARAQLDPIRQYAEQVKIKARYKKVAILQKGPKMLLH